MQGQWWRLDALREEAKALRRLSAQGIPSYVDSFEAAVPGDQLHCILLRLDSAPRATLLDTVAALAADGWRPTKEQARTVKAQLLAILEHQRSFCPPFVHGSIGPDTVLIARAPHAVRSGDPEDAPGGGLSVWLVGPGWDDGHSTAGGDSAVDLQADADLRGAGAALAHFITLGGLRRRPPGALGNLAEALLAGRWPVGRMAGLGRGLQSEIRRMPAGCRPYARLVVTRDAAAAADSDDSATINDCESDSDRGAALELHLPAGELDCAATASLLYAIVWTVVAWCFAGGWVASRAWLTYLVFWRLICGLSLLHSALQVAQSVLEQATVVMTPRALVLTRRMGWLRTEVVVERADAGALRLVNGESGYWVEMGRWAIDSDAVRICAPMARAEAAWVYALLAASWPELAGKEGGEEEKDPDASAGAAD